ncbi:hypothetical protein [Streptomyces sp. UG1]|uniref:hypothetical protein n=1 Tax=Streptomyces sp. UG1 TaxID=3417652 RepID=UPI003CF6D4BF
MTDTKRQEITIPPADQMSGTVGEDDMTVHQLRGGRPVCGAPGTVYYWQRRATCPACIAAE